MSFSEDIKRIRRKAFLTQEDFDIAIGERLKREREAAEKRYAGFDEAKEKAEKYDALIAKDLEGQIKKLNEQLAAEKQKNTDHDKIVSDLTARANKAEAAVMKSRIAHEAGLPYELSSRLTGDTEEELIEKYRQQMQVYKRAAEECFHKMVTNHFPY